MALGNQMQHHIGGRRSPACGKAVAVNHKAIRHDVDFGMGGGEIFEIFPMDGCAIAVQQPRPRENPSACVNRADG